MIAPHFDKFPEEFAGVEFYKIDVDENEEASAAAGINCMPTF